MAKNCLCCGKNIGLLTVRIPLLENEDLVICSDCFEKMPSVLNDLYQKRIHPTKSELLTIKEGIIEQLNLRCYNKDVINVVTKYLDNKISKAKDPEVSEDGAILKKCPICNKNVNYDVEVCSGCGYSFSSGYEFVNNEIANIYNQRMEQYKRNPFYEYDYIVVPNKSDGSTDKEKIEKIIRNHAMQGWRLITMYSNEIGFVKKQIPCLFFRKASERKPAPITTRSPYQQMNGSVSMKTVLTVNRLPAKTGLPFHPYGSGIINSIILSIIRSPPSNPDAEKTVSSRCSLSILRWERGSICLNRWMVTKDS